MDLGGINSVNQVVSPNNHFHHDPQIQQGDRTLWEYHTISVTRVPGYGFGIAVSGGRDNPHFANGDPSIAVSDVLKGGPAEDRLQVNDRIVSVNGVSLENVEYTTAVQVLRDSGNTVTLIVKRRVALNLASSVPHQHSLSMSPPGLPNGNGIATQMNSSIVQNANPGQAMKITLTKNNKKDDYGIVLGCRLFIKEISPKVNEQLATQGYLLQEGDIVTRIHNTNCGDIMSLKDAKKIIEGCKERLNLVVMHGVAISTTVSPMNNLTQQSNLYASHQAQASGCSNNLEDSYLPGGASYSSQNLYVQPPTRLTTTNGSSNGLGLCNEKNNLTPRGRSRGPLVDSVSLQQLDRPVSPSNGRGRSNEPPRPPPPRGNSGVNDDYYSSRRHLYGEENTSRGRQSVEPRFISFQKEGSVGIRLTGGNEAGIFVTAVQPGSPASLQGLAAGDKILKVNDMDMHGVTREEAVLFLLSLQDRIDLIVQHCKEDYDEVVTNQHGDSFHIKTHFHCHNPSKGEMAFKAGDVFRVIDTLHNGVVGSWQVLKIGLGHQEMQRGVIPNKSRAEELATAQFNANKKEMNATESRGNFFKRRRSTHRRSKSLSRENWDDVVFSDSISKFPAYERVVLRHPGFVRPVILFGPVSDLARDKLCKDFPDKFSTPLQDDDKTNGKSRIMRLSNIRDIMDCGKHALLDITPNAVDRLNYAQFYPIVIFLKTDSKHVIKQLRHGLPKMAHKSSKRLLEQCQKLERAWSHIFSTQIVLNDDESWYRKLRDAIDMQQSGAVWMSECKPVESLSDDFLFPMTTSRLSYASSPESDLELSPGPSASLSVGNLPQLSKAISDPSIATNQDNLDRAKDIIGEGLPPPYTIPSELCPNPSVSCQQILDEGRYSLYASNAVVQQQPSVGATSRSQSLYGITPPDLPPRIDRQSKPEELPLSNSGMARTNTTSGTLGRSAQERLFGKSILPDDGRCEKIPNPCDRHPQNTSLERQSRLKATIGGPALHKTTGASTYDSVSSYDSYNNSQLAIQNLGRLGPNAPDDLKSVPNPSVRPLGTVGSGQEYGRTTHDHCGITPANEINHQGRPQYHDLNSPRNIEARNTPQRPSTLGIDNSPRKPLVETKTDYGKYSRNNSVSQADYNKVPKNTPTFIHPSQDNTHVNSGVTPNNNGPFKPVPPPKPKNYRPSVHTANNGLTTSWENGESGPQRSKNGFYYQTNPAQHQYNQQTVGSPHQNSSGNNGHLQSTYNGNYGTAPAVQQYGDLQYGGNNHHYNGGSGTGPYIAPHRGMPTPIGNLAPHSSERHGLDLSGSREQRGSAFELYRKPQINAVVGHNHNMSEMEPYDSRYKDFYAMSPMIHSDHGTIQRLHSAPRYHYKHIPHAQDLNYYNQNCIAHQEELMGQRPPISPHKKKSALKSPLSAIKNILVKTTRPLRRMNSLVEPDRRPKGLQRQRSMLEPGIERPYYPYYDLKERAAYEHIRGLMSQAQHYLEEPLYVTQSNYSGQDRINNTYRNLEGEDIYGNVIESGPNRQVVDYSSYEYDVYANRASIDLQRRQTESTAIAARDRSGRHIVRRHSSTTADRGYASGRRHVPAYSPEYIGGHYSQPNPFMQGNQRRPPNSEVMMRRHFYPRSTNEQSPELESHYLAKFEVNCEALDSQLYASKKTVQVLKPQEQHTITPKNTQSEQEERSESISARREIKETRTQLQDKIYQTRREALDSMAEPIRVSKWLADRPTPIYESREECIFQSRENETDEKKESKVEVHTDGANLPLIDGEDSTLSPSDLQQSSDTVIESITVKDSSKKISGAPLAQNESDESLDDSKSFDDPTAIENNTQSFDVCENRTQEKCNDESKAVYISSHVTKEDNSSDCQPVPTISDSTNSIMTHASLYVGPPNATSTPFSSNFSLPMSGPVPSLRQTTPLRSKASYFNTPRESTTTRGVFDSDGGTLSDKLWQVSLKIPPGAIPAGVRQEIYFTVSDPRMGQTTGGPPLDMENGETMLSPLVMCGPQGLEFNVPVTLNIPHCAGRTASLGLAVKATDSEKNLHTEWDNIDLPSNAAAHTVSVKVDHF